MLISALEEDKYHIHALVTVPQ